MEVPANQNVPQVGNGNGNGKKPDDAYLMMAASVIHDQGRLFKEQQEPQPIEGMMYQPSGKTAARVPGQQFKQPGPGARGEEYSDVEMDPKVVGEHFRAIGGMFPGGVDTSKMRRSENVEDKSARGLSDYLESQADLSLARQKRQPKSQPTAEDVAGMTAAYTAMANPSKMAKQLGINDIDAFMDFVTKQRAKEASRTEFMGMAP